MSMVERVAMRLCARRHDAANDWHSLGADEREEFRAEARDAIDEMREPTEAMLENTVDERGRMRILEFTTADERSQSFLMPRFTYRAMIDAALSEEEERG